MADPALRSLERALAAGEESARVPLAAAYLRQGDAGAALGLLDGEGVLPTEAARVHEEAWRRELTTLAPVGAGPIRVEGRDPPLLGFFGRAPRDDEYAAVGPHVLDLARSDHVRGLARSTPVATTSHAVYVRADRSILRVEPTAEDVDWRATPLTVRQPDAGFFPSPDGTRVVMHDQGSQVLATLPDGDIIRIIGLNTGWDVSWSRQRLAWWSQGRILLSGFDSGPPVIIDVARALRSVAPLAASALPVDLQDGPTLFQFLRDGRLLVGPPLAVVDPSTGACVVPADWRDHEGPARLSRDGRAILAFRGGAPVRVALDGEATPPHRRRPGEATTTTSRAWHPFADVAAFAADGAAEVRAADGEAVLTLPRATRPLGWTPDGRGLLVLRRAGPRSGVELWRAREARA